MKADISGKADMQDTTVSHPRHDASDDEIDLRELFAVLWASKWLIVSIITVFAIISVMVVLLIPNQYQAEAVLASADRSSINSLTSQLNGLASLAGVTLNNSTDESQTAMEVIQSWAFIDKFIKQNNLQVEVFAVKGWDRDSNQLKIDAKLYDVESKKWVRVPPAGKMLEPSSWELYKKFSDDLTVSQDKKTGLVTVSIEYYSPIIAQQWTEKLVAALNDHMKNRALSKSEKNIEYLQEQINKTSLAEMKEVLYRLVENEIKNKMVAAASPEYQFVTVSPAMVPEEKSKPKRAIIVIISTMLGGFFGAFIALVRRVHRNDRAVRSLGSQS